MSYKFDGVDDLMTGTIDPADPTEHRTIAIMCKTADYLPDDAALLWIETSTGIRRFDLSIVSGSTPVQRIRVYHACDAANVAFTADDNNWLPLNEWVLVIVEVDYIDLTGKIFMAPIGEQTISEVSGYANQTVGGGALRFDGTEYIIAGANSRFCNAWIRNAIVLRRKLSQTEKDDLLLGSLPADAELILPLESDLLDVSGGEHHATNFGATPSADDPDFPASSEPPTNLTATGEHNQVVMSWDAMARADSYKVSYSLTPGGPYTELATGIIESTYTDTDAVDFSVQRYYVVKATNVHGDSEYSEEASAKPSFPSNAAGIRSNGQWLAKLVVTTGGP